MDSADNTAPEPPFLEAAGEEPAAPPASPEEQSSPQPRRPRPELAVRVLAGLETGILGSLLMLSWVCVASVWDGAPWYEVPNLWATAIWGRMALYRHWSMMTLGGSCLQIVVGALIGAIFATVFGALQGQFRLLVPGLLTGLSWFGIFAWRNRTFAANAPQPAVVIAYALFGVMLIRVARRGRVLQCALDGEAAGHPDSSHSLHLADGHNARGL